MAVNIPSLSARRALQSLGEDLKVARLKRRISVKDFAERIGVSERTVTRLEKGDNGVSIGTLAMACLVLGELHRISDFLDAGSDNTGLMMERARLPKRIRKKRIVEPIPSSECQPTQFGKVDDDGVGF